MLSTLLEYEENGDLWSYKNCGFNMWAILRMYVFNNKISEMKGYSVPHARGKTQSFFNFRLWKNFLKTMLFFNSGMNNTDAVFFTPGIGQRYDETEKIFKNKHYSDYFKLFDNPLIFEHSFRYEIKYPREMEDTIYLTDYIFCMSGLKSRFFKKKIDYKRSKEFVDEITELFSINNQKQKLLKILNYNLSVTHFRLGYIDDIIDRMDGDIAFIHGASYLGSNGEMTKRFKERGIKTVELQHGYIGNQHPSYNYPSGEPFEIAKEYLPDYFLTYGEYWNEQIHTPSRCIAVGNPHLNNTKEICENSYPAIPKSILIVSQGIVTGIMVKIAEYLSQTFPQYRIIFKLHPGEVPFTERYQDLQKYKNIQIKTYDNIYELISSCDIIIGYSSTTLFEAIAFSNKRIFCVRNDFIPDFIGYKFSSCEELRDAILDDSYGYSNVDSSYLWEPDWNRNISDFFGGLT